MAKGLSDSIEVKDELVAIKILLSMYTGSIKSLQSAILDVSDYVGTINKLSYLNMYVLDKILVGEHKDIWNTAINAKLMKEVKSRQQEKTIPSDLKFTKSLVEIQSAINNLKSKMGTFMVNERHLFSSEFIQIALKNRATKE